jgi:mRNA interferase RelE/StbE
MQQRVATALDRLAHSPRQGDIKKLAGADDEYRLRVGDWRVFFRPDPARRTVVILAIRHRSAAYRG